MASQATKVERMSKKKPKPLCLLGFRNFFCWGTRTRTRKGRTRICSVTITPYPNAFLQIEQPCSDLRVQRYYFF